MVKQETLKPVDIELHSLVYISAEKLYDRYFVTVAEPVSFSDFVNILIVGGMTDFNKQLIETEKELTYAPIRNTKQGD